jgi:hypothetical protein
MHRRIRWAGGLILFGLLVAPAWAEGDECIRLTEEREADRQTALRAADRYVACLTMEGVEDSCTNEFRDLRSAHDTFGSITWRRLIACEGNDENRRY